MAASGTGGGGGGAGAIRAGAAYVSMSMKDEGLRKGLDDLQKKMMQMSKAFAAVGGVVAGVGAAVGGPIFAAFGSVVDKVTDIRKAAEGLGTTTEVFSELAYAAGKAGMDTEGLTKTSMKLGKVLSDAAGGSKSAQESLAKLGINAEDLIGQPMNKWFESVADGLQGLPTDADRMAAAMEALGERGAELLPILRNGGAALRGMFQQGKDMGHTFSNEDAANAKDFTSALGGVKAAIQGVWNEVGKSLLEIGPTVKEWSTYIVAVVKSVREWVSENRPLIQTIAAVGAGLIAAGSIVAALGAGMAAASAAVGVLATAIGAVGAVIGFVFSPLGLGIAALVAAGAVIVSIAAETGVLEEAIKGAGAVFKFLGDTFQAAWGGIKNAFAAGDLGLALRIAVAGLDVIWKGFVIGLTAGWNDFKSIFVDGWKVAIMELKILYTNMVRFVMEQLAKVAAKMNRLPLFKKLGIYGDIASLAGKFAAQLPTERDIRHDWLADRQERNQARKDDLKEAIRDLFGAQKNLANLNNDAAKAARIAENTKIFAEFMADLNKANPIANIPKSLAAFGFAQGGFSAIGSGQTFGLGSVTDKIADNTKRTADGVADMRRDLQGIRLEFTA